MRARYDLRVAAALAVLLAACSASTTDNFTNPVPAAPDTCAVIADLAGCDQGSISYACTTAARPDSGGNTDLVCSDGAPGGGSSTLYCCARYAQPASECAPDTSLVGCDLPAIGFACAGDVSPTDADPTIACSAAAAGSDGVQRYCCTTAAIPPTCAPDPAVAGCGGVAVGYACVGPDAPSAGDVGLACSQGAPTPSGQTGYCCIPFARDAATCDEDRGAGCTGSELGFACAGAVSPPAIAAELTCAAGSGSGTFCCAP